MAKISVKQGSAATVTSSTYVSGDTVNNSGNTGNDVVTVLQAVAGETYYLYGGDGNDKITGGVSNDTISGGNGNDSLKGGLGQDYINESGDSGNDTLDGGDGNDTIYGGDGNDNIKGGLGEDFIYENGYNGNDTVDAGDGNDVIYGGDGNDNIKGGKGNDYIDDGYYTDGSGNDTIDGGDGNDDIRSYYGNDSIKGGLGDDEIATQDAGADTIDGGAGNDDITASNAADSIIGGTGDDDVDGNGGNDTINGGDGNDSIYAEDGNDSIIGGNGNDYLEGGDGNDTVNAGNGNDTLYDYEGNDTLNGDAGNDYFYANYGNDVLNGGTGNDTFELYFEDSGDDSWIGNDTIDGGTGNDTVIIRELSASNFKYTTATVNNVKTVTITNLITDEVQTIKNVEKFTFEFDDVSFNLSDLTHTGTATYFEGYSPEDTLIATPDNGATNDTTPTITLTAQPGSTVEIFVGDVSAGFATEDSYFSGTYTFEFGTLVAGTYSITAVATTLSGEEIATSEAETLTLTVDITAPAAPTIVSVSGGTINLSENTSTTITGTGVFGNTILLTFDFGVTATATVASDGTWSYAVSNAATAFGQGSETVTATQVDAAGNESTTGISTTFTVDTIAPTVTISSFGSASITFTSNETGSLLLNSAAVLALSTSAATYTTNTNSADQATLTARDTAGNVVTVTYEDMPVVYAYGDQSVTLTGDDVTDAVLIAYAATGEASTITGGDNNDFIYGADANDTVSGGAGNDGIYVYAGNNSVDGGAGDDDIESGAGNDIVSGGEGNDNIDVFSGNNTVNGDDGDDEIYYTGSGENLISGGEGNDFLTAVDTNTSNDDLFGGAGDDRITAGGGSDIVGFTSEDGTDTVYNLSFGGSDKIVFFDSGATNTSTGSVNFAAAPTNGDTVYYFTSADNAYGGSYYEFATLTDLAITQSAVQQDNKVLVVNSTNESGSMESITLSGLDNAYILIENADGDTEIWFDPNWGTTDARTLVATLVGVSTVDLDVTDFGIYSSETLISSVAL